MKINFRSGVKLTLLILSLCLAFVFVNDISAKEKNLGIDKPEINEINKGENGKIKACQARESALKKRILRLTNMANNMQDKFSRIAQKIENYYTAKLVPKGKTLSNYDTLVSEINTKKSDVQTALKTAQQDTKAFSCVGDDPKAQMVKFREDMKIVKSALKEYRTSIKNLLVAVNTIKRENTEKPSPTKAQ